MKCALCGLACFVRDRHSCCTLHPQPCIACQTSRRLNAEHEAKGRRDKDRSPDWEAECVAWYQQRGRVVPFERSVQ